MYAPVYYWLAFFASCSDEKDTVVETTTEPSISEETSNTSGNYCDNIKWKYDESSFTFSFFGTGKIDIKGIFNSDNCGRYWSAITQTVLIEEGITEADDNELLIFDNAKTLCLPSTFVGYIPEMKNIEKYVIAEDNPNYYSDENGVLFNKDKTELLLYPENKSGETYRIPESVKAIKSGAITQAKNLERIYVGSNVEIIESANFYEYVEDGYIKETNYEICYEGNQKQWNKLFENEYEREYIDKTKIKYLQ